MDDIPKDVTPETIQTPTAGQESELKVDYSVGWLGKTESGILKHDGKQTMTLVNSDTDEVVFSEYIPNIRKVRRAEFALYFRVGGKLICVMFGDYKLYAIGVGSALSVGFTGTATSRADAINDTSGIEDWIQLFEKSGVMGLNMSPKKMFSRTLKITLVFSAIMLLMPIAIFLFAILYVSLTQL